MENDPDAHGEDVGEAATMILGLRPVREAPAEPAMEAARLFDAYSDYVYRSLQRFGVRRADLLDMTQEVFLVSHRRAAERRGTSSDKTWLFGICMRVASDYRRRAHRRHERLMAEPPERVSIAPSPEEGVAQQEARRVLAEILDTLPLELRAAFVMFEVEGQTTKEIAEATGWPLGTVYTRVRRGRQRFEKELKRRRLAERRGR